MWIGLAAVLASTPVVAQDDEAALAASFRAGRAAYEDGNLAAARRWLGGVWSADPAFRTGRDGAVAYWLGATAWAAGDTLTALRVWRDGLAALDDAGTFDVRTADAFIRHVFAGGHHADYPLAAAAYLRLLAGAGHPGLDGEEVSLIGAHLRELALVLPPDLRRETGLAALPEQGPVRLAPGAADRLVAWWRSQDTAPATRNNERLEEHLERVAYARRHYRHGDGFDDRGLLYIRLGKPSHVTRVQFDRTRLRQKVIDRNLTLHLSDFPENEFWVYEHVDREAQYVFYRSPQKFELGEVQDLVPRTLRTGIGPSERGKARARAVVRVLEEIYGQLSLYHPAYATRYQDVAAFASLLDEEEVAAETARQMQVLAGNRLPVDVEALSDVGLPGGTFSPDRPDLFVQHILSAGHVADEADAIDRQAWVPQVYSNTFDEVEALPSFLRVARFLEADGTTRTEVYWAPADGALYPGKAGRRKLKRAGFLAPYDFLVVASLVQKTDAYVERAVHHHRHLVRDVEEGEGWSPRQYVVRGDTGLYHLALQWDQYAVRVLDGRPVVMGPWVKATTFRIDSLRALRSDGRTLEMSDLKPLLARDGGEALLAPDAPDHAEPYPFAVITPEVNLALYFEIYHLAFGADDRAHYRVEYELARREPTGGLLRFLGGRDEARTTSRYAGSSAGRMARELIVLDLSQWEGSGELEVHVRVTDETTGQTTERSLRFTLQRRAG